MRKNPMAWMAGNHVAANLIMLLFVLGGLLMALSVKQEIFPEVTLDAVQVRVMYPGAGPEEVEEGIILKIEENLSGIEGIKKITATANEGSGTVTAELIEGEDVNQILQEVKSEVDRIDTFPADAERPVISKMSNRRAVLSVAVYGDLPETTLREHTERVREDLLDFPQITQVELGGVRPFEISIEIDEATLRRHNLTLQDVADVVRRGAQDLPAGTIRARGGEVILRSKERKYTAREYAEITVLTRPDGTTVKLGDIAVLRDTFEETDTYATFDGRRAMLVDVYRVADQRPTEIARLVKDFVEKRQRELPEGVSLTVWNDRSEILQQRMDLLLRNAYMGLALVLFVLAVFLELRLAFWVSLGIPISFLGAFLFMPLMDLSINMISLFAFIMALGIVVDDAIVVGENVYAHRRMGKPPLKAAVDGTMEVMGAVTFSILTSVAAFSPLLFVEGRMGKFIGVIPAVVITILLVSLVEAFFVLPAHLSMGKAQSSRKTRFRRWFTEGLERFIQGPYRKVLKLSLDYRHTTVALCVAGLILVVAVFLSGNIKFRFLPAIESDSITASLQMPVGTPVEETIRYKQHLVEEARRLVETYDARSAADKSILRHIYAIVGGTLRGGASSGSQGHMSEVVVFLQPADERSITSREFARRWREKVGEVPGAESLTFESQLIHFGENIDIRLAHGDFGTLQRAGERVKEALKEYRGIDDISDNYAQGKRELRFHLTPEARTLGITEIDLARQVRGAFHGIEALSFQRGRNEVEVMVRYPEEERREKSTLEDMWIRTRDGVEIPFPTAATVERGWGYSTIYRADRKRVLNVTASASDDANPEEILSELASGLLLQLTRDYPGLTFSLEGESEERSESLQSMGTGFMLALFVIYALLAVPFQSYLQPFVVMSAIPFGIIGAVLGHLFMGYNISMMSLFGIVALTGVVVNDSLVLIDFINRSVRQEGMAVKDAVMQAGQRRFRPIILTSLTTFFGLLPMMSETSIQARFLIPMAISLAYGILFTTVITLFLVPSLYMLLEDIKDLVRTPVIELKEVVSEGPEPQPEAAYEGADEGGGPEPRLRPLAPPAQRR